MEASKWNDLWIVPACPEDTSIQLGPRSYCLFIPKEVDDRMVTRVRRELTHLEDTYPKQHKYISSVREYLNDTYGALTHELY